MHHKILFLAILQLASLASISHRASLELGPNDDWFAGLSHDRLSSGDEIILREGVYSDSRRLVIHHSGASGMPITIRAAEGAGTRSTSRANNAMPATKAFIASKILFDMIPIP